MNKFIVFISAVFFLCSCHTVKIKTHLYDKIINRTTKDVSYFIDTNIGVNTLNILPNDSAIIEMEYKNESSETILAYETFHHNVEYNQILIYNLTDTTYIDRYKIQELIKSDILFSNHFSSKLEGYPENFHVYNSTIIDDYIINYFSKDYTMLTKFKDYYKK